MIADADVSDILNVLEDAYLKLVNEDDPKTIVVHKTIHSLNRGDHEYKIQALSMSGGRHENVLLYIHGTSASAALYSAAMKIIAASSPTEVHAIDLPGFGRSGSSNRGAFRHTLTKEEALDEYGRVIEAYVVEVLGGRRVVMLGHSFGAFVALQFASKYPHLVQKLIMEAPGGLYPLFGELGNYGALFFHARLPQSLCRFATAWFPVTVRRIAKRLIDRVFRGDRRGAVFVQYYFELLCDPRVTDHRYIGEFIDTNLAGSRCNSPALPELIEVMHRLPVCMVYGEHDVISPSHQGAALAEIFPEHMLRFEVIRGSGHSPHYDAGMRDFCAVVASFIDEQKQNATFTHLPSYDSLGDLTKPFRGKYIGRSMRREIQAQYAALEEWVKINMPSERRRSPPSKAAPGGVCLPRG